MIRLFIIAFFLFIHGLTADGMTVEKFKKIMNGKESKTVRKELQFIPILKKASVTMKFSYPEREAFTGTAAGTEKYIDAKYILTEYVIPGVEQKFYTLVLWNDKDKVIESWNYDPKGKLAKMTVKPSKVKGRYNITGITISGYKYKGYTDYTPKLISWEGKYYSQDGKYVFSESGNAVPVK